MVVAIVIVCLGRWRKEKRARERDRRERASESDRERERARARTHVCEARAETLTAARQLAAPKPQTVPHALTRTWSLLAAGITVDNRVANLALVDVNTPMGVVPKVVTQTETESRFSGGDLYRLALSRLPDFETRQFEQSAERNGPPRQVEIYTTADGVQDHGAPLYECLHAACCNLELDGSSFVRCPSCSHARYCSDKCLDLDSTRHLKICSGGCGSQPCDALSGR